jgi:anaerobic dimethyl sulfoxide reductase subunit A
MTGNVGNHGGWAAGHQDSFRPALKGIPIGKNHVVEGMPPAPHQLTVPGSPSTEGRIHCAKMWDAIVQGKAGGYPADIKLLYIAQANPLSDLTSNTNLGVEAMEKLDFIVVHELLMTATARYADIVLPVTSFVENEDLLGPWVSTPSYLHLNKVIEPLYERKSDLQICSELAPRLGINNYNDKTEEEWVKWIIDNCPNIPGYEAFKNKGIQRMEYDEPLVAFKREIEDPSNNPFSTPSGKIEIYSQTLADMKSPELPPIPKYFDSWDSRNAPLAKKYPLQLVSAHWRRRVHFQFDDVPWLKDLDPFALWINSIDAETRNIQDGDRVKVFNDRGVTLVQAKVTERIMPGVVFLPESGQFRPDKHGIDHGGCVNVLTSDRYSAGGSFSCNQTLVQVKRY